MPIKILQVMAAATYRFVYSLRHSSLLILGPLVGIGYLPVQAQSGSSKAANCSSYASNRARQDSSAGTVLGSTARGAVGGTVLGAIFGGRGGAGRGAGIGAGVGLIGGGIEAENQRNSRFNYYYQACMRGDLR
jgi:hypothetical protein